jgi:hypothetical protein
MAECPAVPNPTVLHLRQQLRERFPQAHRVTPVPNCPPAVAAGFPGAGFFPKGAISEINPIGPGSGLGLILASMMEDEPAPGSVPELALIDGRDQFDPRSFAPDLCAKLLWVRCLSPEQALQAADLLLRDGNLPRVVLDLLGYSSREIATIRTAVWHRFKQSIEPNASSLIALTPRPIVPCAALRLGVRSRLGLEHMSQCRSELIGRLDVTSSLDRRVVR